MVKKYIKWKLIALIKDKLLKLSDEKHNFSKRADDWTNKINNSKFISDHRFKEIQTEQIKWSNDQYKMYHHKYEAVSDVLKLIETI